MVAVIYEPNGAATHREEIFVDNQKNQHRFRKGKGHSISVFSSSSEMCMDESSLLGGQLSPDHMIPNEHYKQQKEDSPGFSSGPRMHVNDQTADNNIQSYQPHKDRDAASSYSNPKPVGEESVRSGGFTARTVTCQVRQKLFPPYWSPESVNKALEDGQLLKALFRTNAHNRLEAYCKVDGVQSDILVNGVIPQNRAVEGDTVAIIIDPPSVWPRMKGSNDNLNDSPCHSKCLERQEKKKFKPKGEVVSSCVYSPIRETAACYQNESSGALLGNRSVNGELNNGHVCIAEAHLSDSAMPCCCDDAYDSVNTLEKLCSLVSLLPSKRPTGRVVSIIERSLRRDNIVGFLSVKQWIYSRESRRKDWGGNKHLSDLNHGYILLMPTDPKFTKMMVPVKDLPGCIKKRLESNDLTLETELIAAGILNWDEESFIPKARVIQTFGRGRDVEAQIAAILFQNAINASEFPSEVISCVPNIPWEIPEGEFQRRQDLRNLCVFTIDPKTASDLDDALSIERMPTGVYRVGVHIADVSYFVQPNTPLDIDAQIRSTSVYLLQRKLSMLPPILSDNLASLAPGEDRLAFSIFWDINSVGEIIDQWVGRTVINSCCKLSYEHAQEIISMTVEQSSSQERYHWPSLYGQFEWCDVTKSVKHLCDVSLVLKQNRFKDGALSLESPRVVFLFDDEGMPYDSVLSGRRDSNYLVEEFMLLANRTVAEVITRAYPSCALLRRHPEPNARKLREFEAFCQKHGLKLDISSSAHINQSLEHIRGELTNDSVLFDIMMSYAARPMQLASYFCSGDLKDTDNNKCHYALAVPLYTHFTSPLRRYPDIVVHRTLAAIVEAEDLYMKGKKMFRKEALCRSFTGKCFDKDDIQSVEAQEALSISASKHKVPCIETLADIAAHSNEKKLATRHVKDATDKLCMWVLLKKKEMLHSEARVLGLGPKFMSIYISKLAIERRIYYDEVDGLKTEWLDTTTTLIISQSKNKRSNRRNSPGKSKAIEEVALIVNPTELDEDTGGGPVVFPLTLHLLSTIPVVLHAVGGDDGPLDIVARLYLTSYFQ